jgi:hypothetical protein
MQKTRIAAPKKQKSKPADTREVNVRRVSQVLRLAWHNGGWTTANIVALAMFFQTEHRLTYAQRLLASAAMRGWMLARRLPVRSHALAYVLTKDGAGQLATELRSADGWAPEIRPGTTWGEHRKGGDWKPPGRWAHDERAARFIHFATHTLKPFGKWTALNETQVRRLNPDLDERVGKYPDGLLVREGAGGPKVMWIEVEQARKTGDYRRKLLAHLAKLAGGQVPQIRIDHGPFGYAETGKQAFVIFRGVEEATTFARAASRWVGDHPLGRLLYQVVTDDLDGMMLRMGPVVDLPRPCNT